MIYTALNYVVQELNQYLKRSFAAEDDKALLGTILDESGAVPEENRNKVILSLVNLEHETNYGYMSNNQNQGAINYAQNMPYNFNLDVLTTALFSDYNEALKFLSSSIYFFQSKNLFNHQNSPDLDPNIKQLSFEVVKVSYREAHNLWTALGAKYMPSVLFKVRMLSFQASQIQQVDAGIAGIDTQTNPI